MKKLLFVILLIALSSGVLLTACVKKPEPPTDYIRIHIRANGNSEEEQTVKLAVRDEVVAYLTAKLASAEDIGAAYELLCSELNNLAELADKTLKDNGYNYGAKAKMSREEFPTRGYGSLILEKGEYTALIIELGSGAGDNWWCVAFPPLCFVPTGENVVYKSKILEIIEKWRKSRKGGA